MENSDKKKLENKSSLNSAKEMSFTEHLEEMRQAIIISFISLALSASLCFYFNKELINILTYPLTSNVKNVQLIFVSPGEAFMATLKMSLIMGLVLALPIILNRIYWFVAPGLNQQEKILSLPIVIVSYLLFLSGMSFSYFFLMPFGVKFLVEFAPDNIQPMISIGNYISFAASILIGAGLVFELPVILIFLALFKIVNVEILTKFRKYAFLISFIVGAVITPSIDMITQTFLASALYILYEISIVMIRFIEIGRKKRNLS